MGLFSSTSERATKSMPMAQEPAKATRANAPEPTLIVKYKRDHRALLTLFGAAKNDLAAGNLEKAFAGLGLVRQGLQKHVFDENINLYFALERHYRSDLQKGTTVTIFRIDMNGIFKAVLQFFETWSSVEKVREGREQFERELDGLGAALVKRIDDEENALYPLYVGP